MPYEGARNPDRQARLDATLADPMLLGELTSYIAGGGNLTEFTRERDIPYRGVASWLADDEKRQRAYDLAVEMRSNNTKEVVVGQLRDMALVDIADAIDPETNCYLPMHSIPAHVRRAISGVKITELWTGVGEFRTQTGRTIEIKLWDRNKTIETLARSQKMLTDRIEADAKLTLEDLVAAASKVEVA